MFCSIFIIPSRVLAIVVVFLLLLPPDSLFFMTIFKFLSYSCFMRVSFADA